MKHYTNLPPHQRDAQQNADRFNADEHVWQGLEKNRRRRRKRHPELSRGQHKIIDHLEFAQARPPEDAIGHRKDG